MSVSRHKILKDTGRNKQRVYSPYITHFLLPGERKVFFSNSFPGMGEKRRVPKIHTSYLVGGYLASLSLQIRTSDHNAVSWPKTRDREQDQSLGYNLVPRGSRKPRVKHGVTSMTQLQKHHYLVPQNLPSRVIFAPRFLCESWCKRL